MLKLAKSDVFAEGIYVTKTNLSRLDEDKTEIVVQSMLHTLVYPA